MNVNDRHRLERHARRIEELGLWRNAYEISIGSWRFMAGGGDEREISPGDFWPEISTPVSFSAGTNIPEGWSGLPVELELWLGGEGFVEVSNGDHRVSGGLNPFHRSYRVADKAQGGEDIRVDAEVVSKGVFGSNVAEPRLVRSSLVVPQTEVRALERDLSAISETCAVLDDHEAVPLLLDVLDAAAAALSEGWPTATGTVLSRHLEGYVNPIGDGIKNLPDHYAAKALDIDRIGQETWSLPPAPEPLGPLPDEAMEAVRKAREIVAERLAQVKERYPPVGGILLTGHAHLDLAWLWPVAETRRKGRRTFASVLSLMDRYEDFNFNQSSAQLYAWVENDAPEIFEKVRSRIAEGRWETVGGSWVEPDCQIPSGESFARQLLYGQKYFGEKFGRRSTVAWLPDTFGYSPGIPQLLRGAGMPGFFTYKLNWSETNKFPHDLFLWEGIDGSRVVAHSFENPGTDYNGDIAPLDMHGTWRNFRGKRHHPESLFSFGWGDGGGGPSEKMLENYARLKDFPAMPHLRMGRVDEFFATLPRDGLPRWVGELYLELHRGTLTTQAKVKKLNREGEHRLMEAEAFSTLAALRGYEYPGEELERLWKVLLLNQFHDILPGTSISEVYEDTHRELEEVVNSAKKLRDRALHHLSERDWAGGEVFVVNTALHFRPVTVMIPGDPDSSMSALDAEGNALPVQQTEDGLLVHAPDQRVPGLGWTNLRLENPGAASPAKQAGVRVEEAETRTVIENDLLRVEIGQDGSLDRVYDREMDREVLHGRGNRIVAYADKPAQWDAWDVQEGYELEGEEIPGATKVEVVEDGPLRVSVRVERRWRDSSVVQTYRLLSDSRRLDIETHVDWHERQVLLRAVFPLNVRSHEATFETMYGVVKRPTHQNTSWDATRFEVCGHRFADLSEPGYGAALLNDGKYGHSTKDNVLGISLLRSPLYPDPFADEGEHHFTYSLFPHPGGWAEGGVVDESLYLNSPLFVVAGYPTDTDVTGGFVTLEGVKLGLGSLKLAEDRRGVILRLYEPHGARGRCALRFVSRLENAERVNLLEEPEGEPVEVDGNVVRLGVRPFEVVTLRLNLGTGRIAGNSPKGEGMEHRRLGRTGRENSVLIFGGAALGEVTEEAADRAISQALEAGIDHFDTAADYGDSELQYGRWMPEIRDRIFLSTKTGDREKDAARRSIHNSLERLRVDNVDLIQLHAVGDIEDLDRATGIGGALEAALEARDEGLVGAVGITGHGHEAPATHLEALRRYPFDTVLTPWNYVLSTDENYRRDFEALAEEVQLQETGLMIIKTISRRNWTDGDPLESQRRATWYEPFEEQEYIDAAVSFVLARQEITGIAMAGDVGLVPATIEAERNRMPLEKAEETLANAPDYSSPFISMPF